VTPAPPGSRQGNRITALRWKRLLTDLGHSVRLSTELGKRGRCDLLIALHARKSFSAVAAFKSRHPGAPLIVALTGTDLYDDLPRGNSEVAASLFFADRLVVLQPKAIERLPLQYRSKSTAVLQSVGRIPTLPPPGVWRKFLRGIKASKRQDVFAVAVLGHLRDVKDPLRAAEAVRDLPRTSHVHVIHLGAATTPEWEAAATAEMKINRRYHWLGETPHGRAMQVLRRCRLLCVTSRLEGGANVVMEAIALGVPVLSTRIDGSTGILGDDYLGYFPIGDTPALRELIGRCETDAGFYEQLREHVHGLHDLTLPEREREAWRQVLLPWTE